MKTLKMLILFATVFLISQTTIYAQLSYAEGGPSVEDPGLEVDIEFRRYVDATDGNDVNDGKTQATAWQTLTKVNSEQSKYVPGLHILFKRGGSWSGSLGDDNMPDGEENKRIVFGAYGSLSDAKPIINGTIQLSSYYIVRDVQGSRFVIGDVHHSIVYNNICFGGGNNGLMATGESHHTAFVGNLVYDLNSNNGIVLHAVNWTDPTRNTKSHHWILDNISICNGGMESAIATSLGDFTAEGRPMEGDIKIVANRVQTEAVPGLSTRTGIGRLGINLGHDAQYHWIVGNIVSGLGTNFNLGIASEIKDTKISGNIIFKGNNVGMCSFAAHGIEFTNNTVYDYLGLATSIVLNTENISFMRNIILRKVTGGYSAQKLKEPGEMDYNWWGQTDEPIIDGKSFSEWQTATGFDLNSGTGLVAGITQPEKNDYNHDPRNWRDQTFLDQFIPSKAFTGNDGIIPGAFDTDGNRQGIAILPFEDSDLANGGLGWEGPPIVQQRLKELGISWGQPLLAKYPNPKDLANNVKLDSELSWVAGDSTISHDVYIGLKADSLVFKGNQDGTMFDPDTLFYETTYYWRVDQVTNNSTRKGVLWRFSTEEKTIAPELATNPNPVNAETEVRTSLLLSWEHGVRTRSVNVYFGTENPPTLVSSQEENIYNTIGLELNRKYYWRIDGINEWGTTEGDVWEFTTQAVPTLPEGWASLDIGKVGVSGDDSFENNGFTVSASGSGIKENSDQFRYLYYELSGGGEIIARVASLINSSSTAIAGIMIREKLDSTAAHHMIGITAEQGVKAKWRPFNGGNTISLTGSSVNVPYWFKIQRVNNYLVSSESIDGKTWKTVKAIEISMQSDVYMGLAVTSGDNDSLCTALFDNVSINGNPVTGVEDAENSSIIPTEFTIGNYPNPFNPATTIRYDLPESGKVKIQIYDIMGSLVEELVNSKQSAGSHSVVWNGRNSHGVQTASGIYMYRVQFNEQIKTSKMILMK